VSGWIILKSGNDFDRVISGGRSVKNNYLVMYVAPSAQNFTRIGICVGKSIGNAVKRNRVKRRLREILRSINFLCKPADCVIIARKTTIDAGFSDLKNAVLSLLKIACLI